MQFSTNFKKPVTRSNKENNPSQIPQTTIKKQQGRQSVLKENNLIPNKKQKISEDKPQNIIEMFQKSNFSLVEMMKLNKKIEKENKLNPYHSLCSPTQKNQKMQFSLQNSDAITKQISQISTPHLTPLKNALKVQNDKQGISLLNSSQSSFKNGTYLTKFLGARERIQRAITKLDISQLENKIKAIEVQIGNCGLKKEEKKQEIYVEQKPEIDFNNFDLLCDTEELKKQFCAEDDEQFTSQFQIQQPEQIKNVEGTVEEEKVDICDNQDLDLIQIIDSLFLLIEKQIPLQKLEQKIENTGMKYQEIKTKIKSELATKYQKKREQKFIKKHITRSSILQ